MKRSTWYALVAVLSWSTVATAFKITLKYLSHFEMVLVASATALIVFALVVSLTHKWGELQRLSSRQWMHYALLGALNPVAYYLVLFKAYDLLPAHIAQPINYSWPIVLLIMLAVINGQSIPRLKYVGMFISLGGVAMISLGNSSEASSISIAGIALGLLSAVLWATYWMVNNRDRAIRHDDSAVSSCDSNASVALSDNKKHQCVVDGNVALMLSFMFGTLYLAIASPFAGVELKSMEGVLAGMYVGAFEMGIPFVFFAMALRTTDNPALVNQLSYLSPFLSLFLIAMVLGETITLTTIAGLALIVAGLLFNEFGVKAKN